MCVHTYNIPFPNKKKKHPRTYLSNAVKCGSSGKSCATANLKATLVRSRFSINSSFAVGSFEAVVMITTHPMQPRSSCMMRI